MIILLADTPVAGTVNRIALWMERLLEVPVYPLVRRNYAHNAFNLDFGAFGSLPNWEQQISDVLVNADIVFIHNVFDKKLLDIAFSSVKSGALVFFQYHSPPLEPPAYLFSVIRDYPFDHIFAVSQGYGRFFSEATVLPNIVADIFRVPGFKKTNDVFIPHMRTTSFRWSSKVSSEALELLNRYKSIFGNLTITSVKSVFGRDTVTHGETLFYLSSCLAIIDDINTGLFHQTSMEGLKAGCAVFCSADLVSQEEFCVAADCDSLPFIFIHEPTELVGFLAERSVEYKLREHCAKSLSYAEKFLGEERLARRYCDIVQPFLK
jgi:hypothetical protein